MYEIKTKRDHYVVVDENGNEVADCYTMADAKEEVRMLEGN